MKNWLTSATKERLIHELKHILAEHPKYKSDSENVQNKFSFEQRPQRGIIVNNTTADMVRLAADNYMGRLGSFVMLAPVKNFPGTSLEWVHENFPILEGVSPDRSVFPISAGVYIVKIIKLPDDARQIPGEFVVDPIITVLNEPLILFNSTADNYAQLSYQNVYPGSLRLSLNNKRGLIPGVDYSVNYLAEDDTTVVTFLQPTPTGDAVYANYRYQIPQQGPFPFYRDWADTASIPGAVLAFGDRVQAHDEMAVVVTGTRSEVAEVYGGKFEVTFSLVVFARDSIDRERMSDYVVEKVLERQNILGFEGLELLNISPGGEGEEIYNAEIDDYYYESEVSLSMRVDWETWVPIPMVIDRVDLTSESQANKLGFLNNQTPYDLLQIATELGVTGFPVKIGKKLTYERVLSPFMTLLIGSIIQWHQNSGQFTVTHILIVVVVTLVSLLEQWRSDGKTTSQPP